MKTEFNHAANDSPRSGSTKKVTPVVCAVIVAVAVAVAVWFDACCASRMNASGRLRGAVSF